MVGPRQRHKVVDDYYRLNDFIKERYKQRDKDPKALPEVIEACELTIKMIPKLKAAWQEQHAESEERSRQFAQQTGQKYVPREWEGVPPTHVGFPRLIIIRRKQKNLEEVARLEALHEELWLADSIDRRREAQRKHGV